jgi:circadian clock protein KaiB
MTSDKKIMNGTVKKGEVLFRQYVAGKSPNSLRAVRNLKAICRRHFDDRCTVEIVDVLETPMLALRDEVYVSPALIKFSPPPVRKIIGDLSEEAKVLAALDLEV